jgi:hypothetical protein
VPQAKPMGPVRVDVSLVTAKPPVTKKSQFSNAYPIRALAVLTEESVEERAAVPIGEPLNDIAPDDEPLMCAQSMRLRGQATYGHFVSERPPSGPPTSRLHCS